MLVHVRILPARGHTPWVSDRALEKSPFLFWIANDSSPHHRFLRLRLPQINHWPSWGIGSRGAGLFRQSTRPWSVERWLGAIHSYVKSEPKYLCDDSRFQSHTCTFCPRNPRSTFSTESAGFCHLPLSASYQS
jgi:hypothetical protein